MNSTDPDQTASWKQSVQGLYCFLGLLSEFLRSLQLVPDKIDVSIGK